MRPITKLANQVESGVDSKVLRVNGSSVIQMYSHADGHIGSLFLQENSIVVILEGSLNLQYGNSSYLVSKNQLVFLKRDMLVYYQAAFQPGNEKGVKYIMFSLSCQLVKEFIKLTALSTSYRKVTANVCVDVINERMRIYIDSIEPYFWEPDKAESNLIKIKLLELLFNLLNSGNDIIEQVLDVREQFHSDITTTIEDNILNCLSLNQLAKLSGRSLSSFRRDFLFIYNMPPSQWIRQKKLEKAQELLLTTTMTITDICYTTGFENIAHFSRVFKSHFGYCPSVYRTNKKTA